MTSRVKMTQATHGSGPDLQQDSSLSQFNDLFSRSSDFVFAFDPIRGITLILNAACLPSLEGVCYDPKSHHPKNHSNHSRRLSG